MTRWFVVELSSEAKNRSIALRRMWQLIDGKDQVVGVKAMLGIFGREQPGIIPETAILHSDGRVEGDPTVFEWADRALSSFNASNTEPDSFGATKADQSASTENALRGTQKSIQNFLAARDAKKIPG